MMEGVEVESDKDEVGDDEDEIEVEGDKDEMEDGSDDEGLE